MESALAEQDIELQFIDLNAGFGHVSPTTSRKPSSAPPSSKGCYRTAIRRQFDSVTPGQVIALRQSDGQTAGMNRALPALAVALLLTLAGCSGDSPEAAARPSHSTASPTPAATTANPNQLECVNIDRAFNAWDGPFLPSTAEQLLAAHKGVMDSLMDEGKDLADDVQGYTDQPSKNLSVAVAEYNFELSLANVQLTAGDEIRPEQAGKVIETIEKIRSEYRAFKAATCA
jgi:hypothetical protein